MHPFKMFLDHVATMRILPMHSNVNVLIRPFRSGTLSTSYASLHWDHPGSNCLLTNYVTGISVLVFLLALIAFQRWAQGYSLMCEQKMPDRPQTCQHPACIPALDYWDYACSGLSD